MTAKIKVDLRLRVQLLRRDRGLRRRRSASSAPTPRSSTAASRAATARARWTRTSSAASRSGRRSRARSARGTRGPTDGLGGWTLYDHHAYDPVERALRRGDGSTDARRGAAAGRGDDRGHDRSGVGGGRGVGQLPEGRRAGRRGQHRLPRRLRALARRQPVLHNGLNRNDIFRDVSRDGKIYLFAGNGTKGGALTGDGGPAKNAGLGTVQALAAAPDGALIIASYDSDYDTESFRRGRRTARRSRRIAGTLNRQAPLGDGKPAREAHIGDRQRHDRRARRHDLLDRALQPARRLEGPRCASSRRTGSSRRSRGRGDKLPENGNAGGRDDARQRPEGPRDRHRRLDLHRPARREEGHAHRPVRPHVLGSRARASRRARPRSCPAARRRRPTSTVR